MSFCFFCHKFQYLDLAEKSGFELAKLKLLRNKGFWIVTLLVAAVIGTVVSIFPRNKYGEAFTAPLMDKSPGWLRQKGNGLLVASKPDSALAYYILAANKYDPAASPEDRINCARDPDARLYAQIHQRHQGTDCRGL